MDRRLRVDQRRALLDEVEAKQLTFAPTINKNSQRIVERLNRERAERAASSGMSVTGGIAAASGAPGSPRSIVSGVTRTRAAPAVAPAATDASGRPLGRSFLPGHEQETFRPQINPRSASLFRPGIDDKDVYARLYDYGAGARSAAASKEEGSVAAAGAPVAARASISRTSSASAPRSPSAKIAPSAPSASAPSYPVDEQGEPAPGHPSYFNVLAFEPPSSAGQPGKFDFLLRRLLHNPDAAAAPAE